MEDASLDDFLDEADGSDTAASEDGEAADREDDRREASDRGGGGAADREDDQREASDRGGGGAADREDDRRESSDRGGGGAADREDDPAETEGTDTAPSSDSGVEGALADPGDGPVTVTYRGSPDGSTCDECGRTVDSRWRDGEVFLCADCKSW